MAALSQPNSNNKTVTGYPAPPYVAAGYPVVTPTTTTTTTTVTTHQSSFRRAPTPPSAAFCTQTRPTLVHRILVSLIVLFSLMALFFFIANLVLKPQLPEFRVDSATISQLNATGSDLTATWVFILHVKNPNSKLSVDYNHIEAAVFYGDDLRLSMTQLPPFFQDRKNDSNVEFELRVMNEYVSEEVLREIQVKMDNGSVEFEVSVFARVQFVSGSWRTTEHIIKAYCNQVVIGYSRNSGTGSLMGESTKCHVFS